MDQPFDVFEATLRDRFSGVLKHGGHEPNGEACLLEAAHISLGLEWSDTPDLWPDLRPLNDALWSSDALRTQHLTPVLSAYWEWSRWPEKKKVAVMQRLSILTVQFLIAELTILPADIRAMCKAASTVETARSAAWSAKSAAADQYLINVCHLWIQAAQEYQEAPCDPTR